MDNGMSDYREIEGWTLAPSDTPSGFAYSQDVHAPLGEPDIDTGWEGYSGPYASGTVTVDAERVSGPEGLSSTLVHEVDAFLADERKRLGLEA